MEKQNKMAVMPIKKLLFTSAVPLMLSLLVQSLYNIVDSMFVARCSEAALTATTLAYPVQILMIAISVGTGVGINALISRLLGAGKHEEAGKAAAIGIVLSLISAVIFIIAGIFGAKALANVLTTDAAIADLCGQYLTVCMIFCPGIFLETAAQRLLQASGKMGLSMVSLVVGAVTNTVLDPIMIFGYLGCPALGIQGAAIATVIGQWAGAATALLLNRFKNPDVRISFQNFRMDGKIIRDIYKVGAPTILMQAMGSIMNFGMNAMLADATAIAFFGVYYKLQNFLFLPMNGLGQACLPIVGFNYGAKQADRIRETVKTGMLWGILVGIFGTALFMAVPGPLLRLFNASEEMLSIGIPAVRIICGTFAFCAVTTIFGMCASRLGNGVVNMIGTGLRQVVLLLPCFFVLLKTSGMSSAWFAFWIAEIAACLYSVLAMKRTMDKKLKDL